MTTEDIIQIEKIIEDIYNQKGEGIYIDYNDIVAFKKKFHPVIAIQERICLDDIEPFIQFVSSHMSENFDSYIIGVKASKNIDRIIADTLMCRIMNIMDSHCRHGLKRITSDEGMGKNEMEVSIVIAINRSDDIPEDIEKAKALLTYRIEKDYGIPIYEAIDAVTALDAYEKRILKEIGAGQIKDAYYSGMKMLWHLPSAEEAPSDMDWDRLEKLINLIVSTGRHHNVIPPYPPLSNVDRIDLEYDLYTKIAESKVHKRLSGIHQYMISLTNSLVPLDRNIPDNWDNWHKLLNLYCRIRATPELADDLLKMIKLIASKTEATGHHNIKLQEAAVRICRMREIG